MKLKKKVIIFCWILVAIGVVAFFYWETYGSWKEVKGEMIDVDLVRFGFIPIIFTVAWYVLLLFTVIASVFWFDDK